MISPIDFLQAEFAFDVEIYFEIKIPREESDGWWIVGDLVRSVVQRKSHIPEADVVLWLRVYLEVCFDFAPSDLSLQTQLFDDHDRAGIWFMNRRFSFYEDIPT
jgi:hypothetical protein